ncbi:MAG: hypothetical protein V1720_15695 [bacterium]
MKGILLTILSLIIITSNIFSQQSNSNKITGPYLGQSPPGNTPELFAPGIISHPDYFEHSAAVFSPDGNEVYWAAKRNGDRLFKIYFMKLIDGKWTEKHVAPFCNETTNYGTPVFSVDGKKLFFTLGDDIWFVERQGDGWGKAKRLSSEINSAASEKIGSITNNGSIYFIRVPEFEVFVSKFVNGSYAEPIKLDKTINFDNSRKMAVYVAPDESYMILEVSKDPATCELFISCKQSNGSWSKCKKLPIKWGRFPFISPDGKYLFFMTREGIYWVSAKIIDELRQR